jgi:SAM-dependent methyltransferase
VVERVRGQEPGLTELGHAADAGATAHYEDPDYYDRAYKSRRDDIAHYVRLGRLSGGPVLEYGVGTGRIALPLARAGIHVTGIDLSASMLDSLKGRLAGEPEDVRRRVRVIQGDMRTVKVAARYPLVIAAFNTFLHLYERTDVECFLDRVYRHLTPSGRFVFDVSVPHADYIGADPDKRYGSPAFRHPARGLVKYGERFHYDPIRQVLLMTLEFSPTDGTAPWAVPLTHRQFFPQELEALLHYNGFVDIVFSADFTDALPSGITDSLIVSCRRGRRSRTSAPKKQRRPARSSKAHS